jgi:hypothetical protein
MRPFILSILALCLLGSDAKSQYLGDDFYALAPRIRFVSSNISPTGNFTIDDKFNSYVFQPFVFYNSDRKVMFESVFGISAIINLAQPALKQRYHLKPGHRITQNYNRTGNDLNLATLRLIVNLNKKSDFKFGLGLDMEWNVEGVRWPNYDSNADIDNFDSKHGGIGFGSGVYKSRGRFYIGPAAGITHFLANDRLTYSLVASIGSYSGGSMSITKFTLTYALSKRFAVQGFIGYRFKKFKEYESYAKEYDRTYTLPEVKVQTLDGGFSLMFRFNRFGGLGK